MAKRPSAKGLLEKGHVKRLRGWQLEAEGVARPLEKGKKALEKADGRPSPLANKLLSLWAHGVLSAALIREIADLSLHEGAKHPSLVALAQTANWGQHPANAHRDVMRTFCSDVQLPKPWLVKVPCVDPKSSLEKEEEAAIFLPHLVFSHLGEHYPAFFQQFFSLGKGSLEKFWTGVQKTGDDRLHNHPMCLEKHWKSKTIPLFIHGDGVAYQNRDTILVYSWGSFLGQMNSLKQHWLMGCYPKSCSLKSTWGPMWKWFLWSFEALGKGFHPTVGPNGEPLEKGSPFWDKRGTPLHTQKYRAFVWGLQGDHEYFANTLQLPHWSSHWPCWECDCQNMAGATPGKEYKEICLEKQNFVVASHAEHLADPWSGHPIFQLPHLSCKNCMGDAMHILFCKGIYGHLIGGILHYACYFDGPGKVQKKKPADRLSLLFSEIQEGYREQQLDNRLTNLKLSMFTDPQKPWASKAVLDCKAGEAKHLLPAFVVCMEKLFHGTTDPHELKMLQAATSLEKLVKLWDEADMFLSAKEFAKSMALGKEFLDAYKWLHDWSARESRNSFAIVAKHHTFIHLLWNSKFFNPRSHWCYRGEDFVGHISKMAHSVSFGVSAPKLSQKIAPKYRVLVHFLLTSMEQEQLDDLVDDPWDME